jgi:hypothetical protein
MSLGISGAPPDGLGLWHPPQSFRHAGVHACVLAPTVARGRFRPSSCHCKGWRPSSAEVSSATLLSSAWRRIGTPQTGASASLRYCVLIGKGVGSTVYRPCTAYFRHRLPAYGQNIYGEQEVVVMVAPSKVGMLGYPRPRRLARGG